MSHTEIANPKVYSISFTLIGGVAAAVQPADFNGTSQVISIVRTVLAGVAGVPHAIPFTPTGVGAVQSVWSLGCASSVNTDVSTYQINWVNKEPTSNYLSPGVLNGVVQPAAAGQYYAP
jgi:hypothetical protein